MFLFCSFGSAKIVRWHLIFVLTLRVFINALLDVERSSGEEKEGERVGRGQKGWGGSGEEREQRGNRRESVEEKRVE